LNQYCECFLNKIQPLFRTFIGMGMYRTLLLSSFTGVGFADEVKTFPGQFPAVNAPLNRRMHKHGHIKPPVFQQPENMFPECHLVPAGKRRPVAVMLNEGDRHNIALCLNCGGKRRGLKNQDLLPIGRMPLGK